MTQPPSHRRVNSHPRAAWISFLLFQFVMLLTCAIVVIVVGEVMPGTFPPTPAGQAAALRLGIYLTLPVAIAGAIAGIMALLQETHRRTLGAITTALNSAQVLLCLILLARG